VRWIAVIAGYLAFVTWLTWPLWSQSAAALPCTNPACGFDPLYSAWVLAWESHALVTAPLRIGDGNIFFPTRQAVFYGPAGFGALPYFAPAYAFSGNPAVAVAALIILCAALTAAALHAVVQQWTGRHVAGAVAALVFLTNRWVLWGFLPSAPHLMPLQYFPFIALLAAGRLESRGRWWGLLGLVALQCLTDPVYVALAVLVPLGVLALMRCARRVLRREGVLLGALIVAALVALAPVFAGYAAVRRANPNLVQQTLWMRPRAPSELTQLFWWGEAPTTIAPAGLFLIVVGGILALVRRRAAARTGSTLERPTSHAWAHALLWAVVGTVISLDPRSTLHGSTVTTVHALLERWTPLYEVIRAPVRLGVAGLMGLCLLAGLGYGEIARFAAARRRAPRALQIVLAIAALVIVYRLPPAGTDRLPAAYPLQAAPVVPEAFQPALRKGREPLLYLPAVASRGDQLFPNYNAQAMFRSIGDWRPLLNGYSSYWPEEFMARMRISRALPDSAALAELVKQTNVGFVWVYLWGILPEQRARWLDTRTLRKTGLALVARDGPHLLFAVRPPDAAGSPANPAGPWK